jgi:uncharacterized membrane protein
MPTNDITLVFQEHQMQINNRKLIFVSLISLLISLLFFGSGKAQEVEDQPVVRAVLFYSPACGHCENLIQNQLPPLLEQYGPQLKIVAINTMLPDGSKLYQSTVEYYQIPNDRLGVPMLIVADNVMVGGGEIPEKFPDIIQTSLDNGGTDWPDIPGMIEVLEGVQFSSRPSGSTSEGQATQSTEVGPSSMIDKFKQDPIANTIAVIVLLGMVISIIWSVINFTRPITEKVFWPDWLIPVLSIFGMGVAFYLTYVETSGVEAVCGPVGDCNTVQLSPYAILFGLIPVGLLGLIGYALIFVGWIFYRFGPKSFHWVTAIAVWGMAFFGVLFSIYLTFLEPFVIGATCMWCIASAIIITVIFLAASNPAKLAWQDDDFDDEEFEDEIDESPTNAILQD